MIKKKICLIGSIAVGKTSLPRRFVSDEFSDDYLTTLGVKIERRNVDLDGETVGLMIWDLAGRDEFAQVQKSYLVGSSGLLFVADGTRRETVDDMLEEVIATRETVGLDIPAIMLINKADLTDKWEVDDGTIDELRESFPVFKTSALTGEHVEDAFVELTRDMLTAGAA